MHPLYVFEGISRLCFYAELRNGKTYTSNRMIEATVESLKHVRLDATIMARFDKGFPNDKHLLFFEDYHDPDTGFPKEISYVRKFKLYKNLVKKGLDKSCAVYMKVPKLSNRTSSPDVVKSTSYRSYSDG